MGTRPLVRMPPPRQQPGLMDRMGRMVQLRSLGQRQELTSARTQYVQQANRAQEQEYQEQRAVDQIISKFGGKMRDALPEIMKRAPRLGMEWRTKLAEWDKLDAQRKQEILELSGAKTDRLGQLALGITDQATYEAGIKQGVQEGLFDEDTASQYLSVPYDPEKIKSFRRQAMTTRQFLSAENDRLKLQRQQRQDELKEPGVAAGALQEQYDLMAKTIGPAKSRLHWASRRKFLKNKVSADLLALIPEEYSPEAAEQVRELGITPSRAPAEKKEKPPSASGKALAERTKQRAMQAAEKEYRKEIVAIEKDWRSQVDEKTGQRNWYNFKDELTISNDEMLALRQMAEDELISSKEQADESYLAQLGALGFEAGAPVNYRNPAREAGAPQQVPRVYKEGDTAINKQTGERLIFRGGQWVRTQ